MKPARTIRILIADDHEIVRRGLRTLLETQPGCVVVGEAPNGRQAVEMAKELQPDVALLDLDMPELRGIDATRQILAAVPQTEVLILSVHDSEQMVRQVMACGARGYLVKSDAGSDLLAAIEAATRHKTFVSPRVSRSQAYSPASEPAIAELTVRERETAQLLAEGLSNKEVAVRLDISVKTAETHRTNIMRKIGAHSLADVVRYAIRNGIVEP